MATDVGARLDGGAQAAVGTGGSGAVAQPTIIPLVSRLLGAMPQGRLEGFLGISGIQVTKSMSTSDFAFAGKLGIDWVRMAISWADVNPAKGVYDWSSTDRAVTNAAAAGLKSALMIRNTPAWAATTVPYSFVTVGRQAASVHSVRDTVGGVPAITTTAAVGDGARRTCAVDGTLKQCAAMPAAALPDQEQERLAALARYQVLDTAEEPSFDRLTSLVTRLLDVPIALVSLVDAHRQWFKGKVGLEARETPREQAFCAHAILDSSRPLVVPDALADERFGTNPLVTGEPRIRAYAGAPLITPDGHCLGTLCAIDRRPRVFSPEHIDILQTLADLTMNELELRIERRRAVALAEESRRATEELRLLFDRAPLAVWTLDPNGIVLTWNHASEQTFGWTAAEVTGNFLPTVGDGQRQEFFDLASELAQSRLPRVVQRRRRRKDGASIDIKLAVSPLLDDAGGVRGFLSIAQDVSEEIRLRDELRQAALVDPLTGLLNRRGFEEIAARELARARRHNSKVSAVMFDIDHFKSVNDRYGHAIGDQALAVVARVVLQNLRGTDVGTRWGGEEILVLLPDTDGAGARVVAERIRVAVAATGEPGVPALTISGGVATWEAGEDIKETLSRADQRLYQAKDSGRNCVC